MKPTWLFGIAAILCSSPAAADVTARYVSPMTQAVAMTVEVNDKGDSRVSIDNQMALLTVNGVSYLLLSDLSGTYAVTQDDWIAVQMEMMRAMMPHGFGQDADGSDYEMVEGGTETIAGRSGKVWTLRMKTPRPVSAESPTGFDFVVSADPDLALVGRALAKTMGLSSAMMRAIRGPASSLSAKTDEVFAKGTVIRMSRVLRLDRVDSNPVPASEFALPATILTREQFATRSGASPR